jgi:peptidoglycan hydrolase-like protein with peptidoglycan-binding domain
MIQFGDTGDKVKALQHTLNARGATPPLKEDSDFGIKTEMALKRCQADNGLPQSGILDAATASLLGIEAVQPEVSSKSPWMDWVRARLGWTEFDHDKQLSQYWPLSGLNYSSVIGAAHAWCLLLVNAALHETGFKGNGRADAVSAARIGIPCDLKPGCIVVFQWDSGEHHVSFCDHIIDGSLVACLGGNHRTRSEVSIFPRRNIIATRWPLSA